MRLLSRLLLRLLMPLVLGLVVLAFQGRLPLGAGNPGSGGVTATPGGVDPQAEADRVARMLGDLAARLRGGGSLYDDQTAAPGRGVTPAPGFTTPATPRRSSGPDGPRILNGGGAGSFHRAPQPDG